MCSLLDLPELGEKTHPPLSLYSKKHVNGEKRYGR